MNKKSFNRYLAALAAALLLLYGCRNQSTSDTISHGRARPKPARQKVLSGPEEGARQTSESRHSFSFVVFGDSRPATAALPQPERFAKLVDQINKEDLDFVIHTGDTIAGGTRKSSSYVRQYEDFLGIINRLRTPYHIAPGNHDIATRLGEKAFTQTLNRELYYSFDYKDSHFIILSTDLPGEAGRIGSGQLKWLKQDLENNKNDRHIFVAMHRPLYSVMNPEGKRNRHQSFTDRRNEYEIRRLMTEYQVDAVFAGHEHFFNKQVRDGVTYVITGVAGATPYTDENQGGFYHYVKVRVEGDSVHMKVIKLGGKALNPDSVAKPLFD